MKSVWFKCEPRLHLSKSFNFYNLLIHRLVFNYLKFSISSFKQYFSIIKYFASAYIKYESTSYCLKSLRRAFKKSTTYQKVLVTSNNYVNCVQVIGMSQLNEYRSLVLIRKFNIKTKVMPDIFWLITRWAFNTQNFRNQHRNYLYLQTNII